MFHLRGGSGYGTGEVFLNDPLGLPAVWFSVDAGEVAIEGAGIGDSQGLGVAMGVLGFLKLGEETLDMGGEGGVLGEVMDFVGIVGEVEELAMVDLGVADEFPAVVAEGAHEVGVGKKDGVADFGARRDPEWLEVVAVEAVGGGNTGEGAEGGEEVEEVGEGEGGLAVGDAGSGEDEGAAHGVFVQVLFAEQSVAAEGEAVVGGINDDRIGGVGGLAQGVQNTADLMIEVFDQAVVFGELLADDLGWARPGGEVFVAQHQLAVIEGVLRQEVGWEGWEGAIGWKPVGFGGVPGVVGGGEGDVGEEGLGSLVGLDEVDGGIGEGGGGKGMGGGGFGEGVIGEQIADGGVSVVIHATEEDVATMLEGADEGGGAVVPFTGGEGDVAVLAEDFGEEGDLGEGVIDAKPGAAAHEHGAAGNADGAAIAAEAIIGAEAEALVDQAIEVGGADVRVAPGADGLGLLVVGEEEEEVGTGRGGGDGGQEGGEEGEEHQAAEG